MKKAIAIINGGIGSKVICAVTDDVTLEAAPIKGTDNGDGTASLLVTSSMAVLPDTTSGDLADINAASASINDKLPALVGGKIPVDASVSIDPAGLATEATAGDIKTAVEALAGATPDTAAGDLADINAAAASIDGKLPALVGGKVPVDISTSVGSMNVKIDQAIPGTTNLVNVNGGPSQTADIKVTLDSETIAVTGPLTDAQLSAQSLAKDSSLTNILNKIIAEPSTAAKQDLIITALGLIATEATAGDIKTAVEALAGATPDTAAGDLAAINSASASIDGKLPALVDGKIPVDVSVSIDSVDIGDVDIKEFPAGNLGQQLKAASLSVAPATDITDATYIGDIKFGEELPAGTQLIGKIGIDQTTPGITNLVNVNGGASQSADIKVTLDSESVAVTGPLTNAELTAQALATEATLGTMQADIALMKADLAAILDILES